MTRPATTDAAEAYEARTTWWSAVAINTLVLGSALDRLVSEPGVTWPSLELSLRLGGVVFSLAILSSLLTMRAAPRLHFVRVAWALGIVPFLVALPLLAHRYDLQQRSWEPLFRHKLALLLLGTLTPPRVWLGLIPMLAVVADALVEYFFLGLDHSPYLWPAEPQRTVVYALVATALLYRRARDMQRERALVQREHETQVVERLARVALAVHDMTSSPLQTLVAGAALVAEDPTQSQQALASMARAVEKLQSLNEALAAYQRRVDWRAGDESFDPRDVIAGGGALPRR